MSGRGYLAVEGHGETSAALNLVTRLWADLGLPPLHWEIRPGARLPFPAAAVLLRREFETLFLPSLWRMAGKPLVDARGVARPGLRPDAHFTGDPEGPRDAKGEIGARYTTGRYKPALDQLALTRLIDFADLRDTAVPAFGTLERALRFLAQRQGASAVYPPPTIANPL